MPMTAEAATAWDRAQAAGELSVEAITDFRSFEALEPVWNRLLQESRINNPFLSHEWLHTWWESFGENKELCVLMVKDGDEVLGLAPLMLSRRRFYGLPLRCLGFVYNSHTPRCDFIVARRADEVCRAIWNYIRAQKDRWRVLELCQLPAGSPALEKFSGLAPADGFSTELWPSSHSPYLSLEGSWDSYFAGLDRKHRQNLRRRLKRLQEAGQVAVELVSSGAEIECAFEDALRLEGSGWKEEAGTAIGSRPELRRFYSLLAERMSQRGWLRLYFLTVNGRRVAFGYFLWHQKKIYLLKQGYDRNFSSYSPFNLLCSLILEEAFAGGIEEFDFLGESETWKHDWTQDVRPHYWLYVFSDTPGMRLLRWIKFGLVPKLQRQRWYLFLRDSLIVRSRRGVLRFWEKLARVSVR